MNTGYTERKNLTIPPVFEGIPISGQYSIEVDGCEVPVHSARVPVSDSIPRLNRAEVDRFGTASFASFDLNHAVAVTVHCRESVESACLLPTSLNMTPDIQDRTVSFHLAEPAQITLEINGDWHESLHIFANPVEVDAPSPDDPGVVYYGPGVHDVESLEFGDGTTLYIAAGAVIRCLWESEYQYESTDQEQRKRRSPSIRFRGQNVTIRGRGIIDGGSVPWKGRNMLVFEECENVKIEGVILLDSSPWTLPIRSSRKVHVDNLKIIGWRDNSDGIDICNSSDVLVENCFLRTFDDLVVVKTFAGGGEAGNIHVRRCVLWNELAHALSIGAEVRENVSHVVFEDCDIIHDVGRETALRIYHCDDAIISNIIFRDIRIEEARRLISCWIGQTRWTETEERGHIRDVEFRNIQAASAAFEPGPQGFQDGPDWKPYVIDDHATIELVGFDDTHCVENVRFSDVLIDGKKVDESYIEQNSHVRTVVV